MKKDCKIIKDLLPLYHEELTSDESNEFIKDHLKICSECNDYSADINDEEEIDQESTNIINKLQKTIIANKMKSVFVSVLIALIIGVLFVFSILSPEYLAYDKDKISVSKIPSSDYVLLELDNGATEYEIEQEEENIYTIITWTSTLDKILSKKPLSTIIINTELEQVDCLLYSEYNSSESIEIFGSQNKFAGMVVLPRLVIGMYFYIAVFLAIILFVLKLLTKKWLSINKLISVLLSFTIIYMLITLITMGGSTSTYTPIKDLSQIVILSIITNILYVKISDWRKDISRMKNL